METGENDFDEAAFVETLTSATVAVGVPLTPEQTAQCVTYARLLLETNAHTNLTRITESREMAVKHFADSLTVLAAFPPGMGASVCDVGTGAGFPGVVLKIARPDLQLTLLDSLKKRLTFLDSVCAALHLQDVATVHANAVDAGRDPALRDRFDVVTARAVAALPVLLEWCAPLVKSGKRFVAQKSGNVDDELAASVDAAYALNVRLVDDRALTLPAIPGSDEPPATRRVLLYEKVAATPKGFPRLAAEIKRKPL
ncbi:MAG: 16S rRNA (guanine(527)-N(7))-methyltransferase RsmG [Armatimonadetes bacterium]|nr:16S rRNA (guanine(527)-N(7))-methyltransferase RsmG [Armatimonadota bacterium]